MRTLTCICLVATLALAPRTSLAQGIPTEPTGGSRSSGGPGESATIGALANTNSVALSTVDLSALWLSSLTAQWMLRPSLTRMSPASLAHATPVLAPRGVLFDGLWSRRTRAR